MFIYFYYLLLFTTGSQIRKIFEDLSPVYAQTNRKLKMEVARSSQKSVTVYLLTVSQLINTDMKTSNQT